jgi:hypothetical protein
LTPIEAYACHKKQGVIKNTCAVDTNSKKADCCVKGHFEDHTEKCKNPCGNPNCQCNSAAVNYVSSDFYHYYKKLFFYKNSSSYYNETYASSGFYVIWQPPKIS